ncbi:MAG: hypothetical protein JSS42_01375 [Proteobacteria bacterium]|uniref:hypothetical protein n=1 Tax=Rudaea sp. TaxID=2136325 RepID=UPI0032206BD9|nr:hypothetical protein [Pseudomonadota bacterium]
MNTSTPVIRLGLLALTGAIVLGAATLHSNPAPVAPNPAASALPVVTLGTVTVRPDAAQVAVVPTVSPLPVLPVVHVGASEEEVLAARIDPSDRIQVLSTITVQPSAEEIADAMRATAVVQVGDEEERSFLARAVAEPHRLRLDMPYYSFGKVLTRSGK